MSHYRTYIIGADGEFMRAVELLCRDDETAKEYAKQLAAGVDVELWQDDRKVARFTSAPT